MLSNILRWFYIVHKTKKNNHSMHNIIVELFYESIILLIHLDVGK